MADLWGQFDSNISGASDAWDDANAGTILLADYFAPPSVIGRVKMWTGAAWKSVRAWNGSQWVAVKAWTGGAWL